MTIGKYEDLFIERRIALAAYTQERRGLPKLALVVCKPAKTKASMQRRKANIRTIKNWQGA